MHSDLRFNPSSGLCINLFILHYIIYVDPLFRILGCNYVIEHNRTPRYSYETSAVNSTLSSPNKNSLLDYLATKPEVEGFKDQGVVLPEVESLRVQKFMAS